MWPGGLLGPSSKSTPAARGVPRREPAARPGGARAGRRKLRRSPLRRGTPAFVSSPLLPLFQLSNPAVLANLGAGATRGSGRLVGARLPHPFLGVAHPAEAATLPFRCHRLLPLPPLFPQPRPLQQLGLGCASLRQPTVTSCSEAVNSGAQGAGCKRKQPG